ncbi:MAG: metallophosphoesterase [Schlesneria sp.]
MFVTGGNGRRIGFADRKLSDLKTSVDHTPFSNDKHYEEFTPTPGKEPYHMELSDLLHSSDMAEVTRDEKLVFHVAGDTGNFKNSLQLDVAELLVADAKASNAKFFYHLGDVVYDFGEDREYPDQFYEVYQDYKLPIVAIPGNHDGARFQNRPSSLAGFQNNFCAVKHQTPPSLAAMGMSFGRDTMTQPNCYWTLNTPLFTIIGLYTNVPSGGILKEPQISWFNKEIKDADRNKPLIVAMHHPVHSVAKNPSHQGSNKMKKVLEDACTSANRYPELVLAGHVHNYQRFTTKMKRKNVVFVVAGCGGHAKDPLAVETTSDTPAPGDPGVTLNYATRQYVGFLRMTATSGKLKGEYVVSDKSVTVADSFEV